MARLKEKISAYFDIDKNSRVREEWLSKVLNDIKHHSRILDAGAGELNNRKYCQHLDYVSQDFCEYDGGGDMHGLQTGTWDTSRVDIVSDIIDIPEKDESFDVIICTEVFEHIPDPVLVLNEFHRLLKKGGKLILTAPFASKYHFSPFFFYTGFSKYWYQYHLERSGFSIEELTPNGSFKDVLWNDILLSRKISSSTATKVFLSIQSVFLAFSLSLIKSNDADKYSTYGYFVVSVKK